MPFQKRWKRELHSTDNNGFEEKTSDEQNCNVIVKRSKVIYQVLKALHVVQPTCIRTWAEQYGFIFDENEWNELFRLPWKLTRDYKLIEFQYKILHKVFASKSHVNRFDKSISEKCRKCNTKANTIHMFYECEFEIILVQFCAKSLMHKPYSRYFVGTRVVWCS